MGLEGGIQVREQLLSAPFYILEVTFPVFLMPVLANSWDSDEEAHDKRSP